MIFRFGCKKKSCLFSADSVNGTRQTSALFKIMSFYWFVLQERTNVIDIIKTLHVFLTEKFDMLQSNNERQRK